MRIGSDLILSTRFIGKSDSFYKKYFLDSEMVYAKSCPRFEKSIAGVFACKEAFLKAIGVGVFKGIRLNQIKVDHVDSGKPVLIIDPKISKKFNILSCDISISHDGDYVFAVCVIN